MQTFDFLPLFASWTTSQIGWSVAIGTGLFLGTALIGGLVVIYLPATYFSAPRSKWSNAHPAVYWSALVAKNLLGVVLIVLGIAMLVLPGQGLLTILIGLMLLDIPGKRRLIAALLRRSNMLDPVNRWRAKFGRAPLELPGK
jgi:hypothetical protein